MKLTYLSLFHDSRSLVDLRSIRPGGRICCSPPDDFKRMLHFEQNHIKTYDGATNLYLFLRF